MNQNDVVSDKRQELTSVSYQTTTDLQAAKVAGDDMIYVTQKKQQIKMLLLV